MRSQPHTWSTHPSALIGRELGSVLQRTVGSQVNHHTVIVEQTCKTFLKSKTTSAGIPRPDASREGSSKCIQKAQCTKGTLTMRPLTIRNMKVIKPTTSRFTNRLLLHLCADTRKRTHDPTVSSTRTQWTFIRLLEKPFCLLNPMRL